MKRSLFPLALVLGAILASPAPAQFGRGPSFADLGRVSVEISPKKARPGETVQVKLTVAPNRGSWTYPVHPKNPLQKSVNSINWMTSKPSDLIFVGNIVDPPGAKLKPREDPAEGTDEYYPHSVEWTLAAVVSPQATPGTKEVPLAGTSVQICGTIPNRGDVCMQSSRKDIPRIEFTVLDQPAVPVDPKYAPVVEKLLGLPSPPTPAPPGPRSAPPSVPPSNVKPEVPEAAPGKGDLHKKVAIPPAEYEKQLNSIAETIDTSELEGAAKSQQSGGLLAFLITAATWGFVSLVTPCVFPMIPITISIFLKQSNQSRLHTVKLASVYCLTIILVLGVSAIALLKVFVDLSVNPWMNLFLGGLFVFFALSLFGMYDITLPNSLLKFTQTKQGGGGMIGTVFGALAFTIVSFTCVAPFLGGFAGMATSGNFSTGELALGGLTFAAAFAFPFFLLALFPRLLKTLPRSGGWLDSVKVVMGFLEVAAALKFFRTAEIGWNAPTDYFTYDLVLGGWVAILFAAGLYLLNAYRLPHDEEKPNIGVPRLAFALAFLGLSVYLAPALLKTAEGKSQRPSGVVFAWVDAFLLPEAAVDFGVDLQVAMDRGRASHKPVFIDFTGQQCTNCRYNEAHIFTRPEVWALMEQYERVSLDAQHDAPSQIFVDPPSLEDRREEAEINKDFKSRLTGNQQLPLYVILIPEPDGRWKAKAYDEGKINRVEAFKKFLAANLPKKN